MTENNEQWKLQGNCNECRRQKYCSTGCKAHKLKLYSEMSAIVASKMDEKTGGAYSQVMSSLNKN